MSVRHDLLARIQSLIERTYGLPPGPDAALYVIGDEGLARLYAEDLAAGRPMLIVRHVSGSHLVRVYYPDSLVENLEANDPSRALTAENIRDFSAFVEEIDHFLQVAACVRRGREVAPVELELHANVTKVLVAWLFAARTLGVERLGPEERAEVRHELLERGDYGSEEPALQDRYRDARRHAVRFLRRLEHAPSQARPRLLRTFSRAPLPEKLAMSA